MANNHIDNLDDYHEDEGPDKSPELGGVALNTSSSQSLAAIYGLMLIGHPAIRVKVSYYNDNHQRLLEAFPSAAAISKIVENPIEIATSDFLAYALFYMQDSKRPQYHNFDACARRIAKAAAIFDDEIEHNGISLQLPHGAPDPSNNAIERMGEAVGLSVMGHIYNVHQADWTKIGIDNRSKSLDFLRTASDGSYFLELETKGSANDDNVRKSDSVTHMRQHIEEKKIVQRGNENPESASNKLRFGTISVIDARHESVVRCWLLDPPNDPNSSSPRSFRLMQRMQFLSYWISLVSPVSRLSSTLATRSADIRLLADPFELSGSALRNGNGEPFQFSTLSGTSYSSFFATRSRVDNDLGGGVLAQWNDNALLFLGIRPDLVDLVVNQEFDAILSYAYSAEQLKADVRCMLAPGRFENLGLKGRVESEIDNGYMVFTLSGLIQLSTSGLVFGILPLP